MSKTIHCAWIVIAPVALFGFGVMYAAVGVTFTLVWNAVVPEFFG